MEKFLVTIEFKYSDSPYDGTNCTSREKIVTIGVYDDFDEACINGNKVMEMFEDKYPLNRYANGTYSKKERFSKNGGCFGNKKTLISNLGYLKTPFTFYAKIDTLKYDDLDTVIDGVTKSIKNYVNYKKSLDD